MHFPDDGISGRSLFKFGHALRGKKTQVNFHEIWIGAYPRANCRRILHWLETETRNSEVHKHQPAFRRSCHPTQRRSIDCVKKEFTQITNIFSATSPSLLHELEESNQPSLRIAFFGTLYDSFPYQLMGRRLQEIDKLSAKTIELRIIGRQREDSGLK